ncbi:hypothetical protein QVD99_003960 [Batrachochytrium dendrobatidis]|nr:hypothetical protein O5D80_002238 [Batrachochytrium dendrobatidis]KAK5669569.1 hypothetical protein QVD99_003960 [Batrachochytrium dendrobatidis]
MDKKDRHQDGDQMYRHSENRSYRRRDSRQRDGSRERSVERGRGQESRDDTRARKDLRRDRTGSYSPREKSLDMDVDRKYDDRHKRSSRKRSTSRERSTRRQSFSSADSDEHGRRKRSSEPLDRNKSKKHKKSSSSKKSRETSKERLERKAIRSSEKKLLKKEMEDQNLSMIAAGMSAELGYTNLENPFGDNNLHQKFVWVKKREADTKKGITAAERSAAEEQRRREAVSELEKLSKRRAEREIEQQLREQEQLRMQQERDAMEVGDWISKEDDFHLEQAKLRAQIRVKEGRAKPIDVLAINLSIGTDSQLAKEFDALGLEMDMNEPYLIFKSLTMKETEELHHDIMLYLGLEKSAQNKQFWEAMMVVCDDELGKHTRQEAAKSKSGASHQTGVSDSVNKDIERMLEHKSFDQLALLQQQIETKLSSGDPVDVEYWEATIKAIIVWRAKAKLRDMHTAILERRLQTLRETLMSAAENNDISADNAASVPTMVPLTLEALALRAQQAASTLEELDGVDGDDIEQYDPCMSPPRFEGIEKDDEDLEIIEEHVDLRQLTNARKRVLMERATTTDRNEIAMLAEVAGVDETDLIAEAFVKEAARDMDADESVFKDEAAVATASYLWQDKYRPRKPRYFNRVHTGYEWNKYNQTHYDHDNPPPKVVQGYKFNVFYPDLIDKTKAPTYKIEKDVGSEDTVVIRFIAGPPYEDVAFKIVKREWEYSHKKGFRSSFDRGILQLWFHFKRHFYRR